ncbi:MAG: 2-oxoglutarate ferredoxin oxidoreductase subunit gamma [Desulfobacterales bacterium]|nr:MAG: 2-oxoglutarate ferredoxin oxidoreductase subunit gamma [Desulfobacterales bacterium]
MIKEKSRLVFSGSGGQGVITASIILAEAAALIENLNATQAQAYGPEARGGATRADVIISDNPIRYPKVRQPNILVSLTQEAYDKFSPIIRPGGLLLTDPRFVTIRKNAEAKHIQLPMYQEVMDQIGKPIVFNIFMLGALIGVRPIVKPESLEVILEKRIPTNFMDMNRKALSLGLEMGRNA